MYSSSRPRMKLHLRHFYKGSCFPKSEFGEGGYVGNAQSKPLFSTSNSMKMCTLVEKGLGISNPVQFGSR
jgi:hypothetical protein